MSNTADNSALPARSEERPFRVQIHQVLSGRNKDMWAVTDRRPGQPRRVIAYVEEAVLTGVTFVVTEDTKSHNCRQWVVRRHCRKVHAWAVGMWMPEASGQRSVRAQRISYNPYVAGHFYCVTDDGKPGCPVWTADRVVFTRMFNPSGKGRQCYVD